MSCDHPQFAAAVRVGRFSAEAPAMANNAEPNENAVWNWQQPNRARPDHIHARVAGGDVIVIVTGSASGSLTGRLGGIRLPANAAAELARFILAGGRSDAE